MKDTRAAGQSGDVTARIYHTENGVAHPEGETYSVTDKALLETLRGIGFVSIEGWTEAPPPAAPVLTSLTPATAVMGAAGFTLAVAGTGFTAADVVAWNGVALVTTFGSATALSAPVDAAALAAAASVPVTVGASNTLTFAVTAAR